MFLGGAGLQRCGKRFVWSAALAVEATGLIARTLAACALWRTSLSVKPRDRSGSRSTKPFRWRCSTTTTCSPLEPQSSRARPKKSRATCAPIRRSLATGNTCRCSRPPLKTATYLHDSTEADLGLGYLIERGKKRQHRLQAAKDITAQTRSLVADNERSLTFNVASLFVNVQLAESTLELAEKDLKSFRQTVDLSELRYKAGAISEDDYLKIKLQLLQFETDFQQAQLARVQALSDLRQLLGYESVSPDYDVAGPFDYQPVKGNLEDLQSKAMQNRPDLSRRESKA